MSQLLESRGFETITVATSGGPLLIPCEIRRSAKARRIRLALGEQNQARLIVPDCASVRAALEFLHTQGDWLARQLRKAPPPTTLATHLAAHPRLSGLGHEYALTLEHTAAPRPFFVYSTASAQAEFRHPAGESAEPALKYLLVNFAREVIPPRVHELAQRHALRLRRISVRDQGTRWGSCSGRRTVSLNWRLVLLPANLHDYVIFHELAHLTEMNHAEAFWRLLRTYDEEAAAHDRALTRASRPLMRLGRAGTF